MLGAETEKRLAQVLKKYADHEKDIETQRIEIAKIYCFEPRTAFKRIDRNQNYCISAQDIQAFLSDNSIFITQQEANILIAAYDADKDGCLDYKEYEKLVLPSTQASLKMRAYGRLEEEIAKTDKLHYEIEYQLTKLIRQEIRGLKDINLERQLVKARFDFERLDSFTIIDAYKINCLMREDLKLFLNKNGIQATQFDADNLLRRIDMDQDGIITYSEYCNFLEQNVTLKLDTTQQQNVLENQQQRLSKTESRANLSKSNTYKQQSFNSRNLNTASKLNEMNTKSFSNLNAQQFHQSMYIQKTNTTPLRKNQSSEKFKSPSNVFSSQQLNMNMLSQDSFNKEAQNKTTLLALQPRKLDLGCMTQREKTSVDAVFLLKEKQKSNSPMKGNQEEKLVDALKELIRIELQLEKDKQSLSLKADFNLFDAFRQFDKYSIGYLTINELINGLEALGVTESRNDTIQFFKKYDKNNECRIKFSDFAEMVCPKDKVYAEILSLKKPNYQAKSIDEMLSRFTKKELAKVLRNHIQAESQAESIRQGLTENPQFSISEAFQAIDSNYNGYLTKEEFSSLLENHNFHASKKELDLVFERFDKDGDGRVTFSEFFHEIAPNEAY